MKSLLYAAVLVLASVSCHCQDFDLGKTRATIERSVKSKGGKISHGINKDGYAFIMDEDYDGMTAWFFDDSSICISFYIVLNSEQGKKGLIELRETLVQRLGAQKISNNVYKMDDLYLEFSTPTPSEIALLVYKTTK